MTLIPISILT